MPSELVEATAVGLVAAVVYALHGFHAHLDRDLGIFVYGAERVAHGVPPYVGSFNTVGPLADAVPGVAVAVGRLVGVGPVVSSRALFWLLSAACVALVHLLGRRVTGSRTGGLLAAAVFLPFGSFLSLATDGPREKTLMVLFLVAALHELCRRRWISAGVLTALATLTWQPVLFPLAAAAIAAAAMSGTRLRASVRYLAGGVVVAALAAGAFALAGALPRALLGFLVANALWVHQPSALSDPAGTWALLWHGYHLSLLAALLGPVVLVVAAVLRRRPPLVLTAAGAVGAVGWTATAVNGGPDLFVVLPFGAVGTAVLLHALVVRVRARVPRAGTVLVVAACTALVASAAATAVTTRSNGLPTQAQDVRAVLASLPQGSSLTTIDAPQPLALTGRTNPGPFLILDSGETGYLDHRVPGGTVGYLTSLVGRGDALLALGGGPQHRLITQVVRSRYRLAAVGPGWDWYVARRLGPAAALRVHHANHRALAGHDPTRLRRSVMTLTGGTVLVVAIIAALVTLAAVVWLAVLVPRPGRRSHRLARGAGVLVLALLAQGLAVLAAGLVVNDQYDFYASWSDLAGQGSTNAAVIHVGGLAAHGQGHLVLRTIHRHRVGYDDRALIWLPPQYGQPAYRHHRFPVVMFLPGQPSSPEVVFHQFDFAGVASRDIANGVPPFIGVFPTLMVDPPHDTECTNLPQGPAAESWLTRSVPAYVRSHFRVLPTGRAWSVMGWSTGGFCAAKMMLGHQREFGSAVSFGGYYQPLEDHTTGDLFGGSIVRREANSPTWLYRSHRLLQDRLLLVASRQDRESWPATRTFLHKTSTDPHVAFLTPGHGGHNYRVYRNLLPAALRWSSQRWGVARPRTGSLVRAG